MDFSNYEAKVTSEIPYFFMGKGSRFSTVKFTVVMKDEVDGEILRHAAHKAAARFPYLSVKLDLRQDGLYLVHNPLPLAVICTEAPVKLCAEETNYHLHAVTYTKHTIQIPALHALYDGLGGTRFRQTLLYYYCQEKYDADLKAPDGAYLLGNEIDEGEYENPFASEKLKGISAPASAADGEGMAYTVFSDNELTETDHRCLLLKINESDFQCFCKQNGTSVFAMSIILYAKAINSFRTDKSKPIVIGYPTNARNVLGVEKTVRPAVVPCGIALTDSQLNMTLPELGEYVKASVKKSISEDVLMRSAAKTKQDYDGIADIPVKEVYEKVGRHMSSADSPLISYMGRLQWGDMLRYIKYGFSTGNFPSSIICQENSMNGYLTMSFNQTILEDKYVRAICAELDKNGIGYELEALEADPIAYADQIFDFEN
ncbi:MAG: hypothetical protein Q4A83_03400 [Bacillota bacterium]|nr:hypothetical protein [Bacillota bacterium]